MRFGVRLFRMERVNTVQLVGEVRERPFRPGEGNRVVVKVRRPAAGRDVV